MRPLDALLHRFSHWDGGGDLGILQDPGEAPDVPWEDVVLVVTGEVGVEFERLVDGLPVPAFEPNGPDHLWRGSWSVPRWLLVVWVLAASEEQWVRYGFRPVDWHRVTEKLVSSPELRAALFTVLAMTSGEKSPKKGLGPVVAWLLAVLRRAPPTLSAERSTSPPPDGAREPWRWGGRCVLYDEVPGRRDGDETAVRRMRHRAQLVAQLSEPGEDKIPRLFLRVGVHVEAWLLRGDLRVGWDAEEPDQVDCHGGHRTLAGHDTVPAWRRKWSSPVVRPRASR